MSFKGKWGLPPSENDGLVALSDSVGDPPGDSDSLELLRRSCSVDCPGDSGDSLPGERPPAGCEALGFRRSVGPFWSPANRL